MQNGRGKSSSAARLCASADMTGKNAANVLPVPVGEQMSVLRPASASGSAAACGGVGVQRCSSHHAATIGWSAANASCTIGSHFSFGHQPFLFFSNARSARRIDRFLGRHPIG